MTRVRAPLSSFASRKLAASGRILEAARPPKSRREVGAPRLPPSHAAGRAPERWRVLDSSQASAGGLQNKSSLSAKREIPKNPTEKLKELKNE